MEPLTTIEEAPSWFERERKKRNEKKISSQTVTETVEKFFDTHRMSEMACLKKPYFVANSVAEGKVSSANYCLDYFVYLAKFFEQ